MMISRTMVDSLTIQERPIGLVEGLSFERMYFTAQAHHFPFRGKNLSPTPRGFDRFRLICDFLAGCGLFSLLCGRYD
jgi:hypothetical protein